MKQLFRNHELQKRVQDAINFKSPLNAATIVVLAIDGVIILTGTVDSYARKWRAEDIAKNVAGVSTGVDAIEINPGSADDKIDLEITCRVLTALKLNFFVPANQVKVMVQRGHVTLSGEVHRPFQKEAALKSAGSVTGVKALTDEVIVTAYAPAYC
ncbi:MAG: BON domain-containing protein [Bacteroidota bacterium]